MSIVTPSDVYTSRFVGSVLNDAQLERMLQCIVISQCKMNPNAWTPFTWKEYTAQCDHTPVEVEHQILEAMVKGGEVILDDMGRFKPVHIQAGLMSKNGDHYTVTDKLQEVMAPFAKAA